IRRAQSPQPGRPPAASLVAAPIEPGPAAPFCVALGGSVATTRHPAHASVRVSATLAHAAPGKDPARPTYPVLEPAYSAHNSARLLPDARYWTVQHTHNRYRRDLPLVQYRSVGSSRN